jgi:16S rRNA (cytidine1402-2'-O)-methyltransferase
MTKLHEQIWRGTVSQARHTLDEQEPRGEFTIVINGATEEQERWDAEQVRAALEDLLAQGIRRPDAARQVAELSGWDRGAVYKLAL